MSGHISSRDSFAPREGITSLLKTRSQANNRAGFDVVPMMSPALPGFEFVSLISEQLV